MTYIYSCKVSLTVSGISDDVISAREGTGRVKGEGESFNEDILDLDSL